MKEITRWRGQAMNAPSHGAAALGARSYGGQWEDAPAFRQPDAMTVVKAIFSNLRLIAIVTLAGALAAFAILRAIPQQFTAGALIMLDSKSTLLDETESVFAGLPIADTYIESEIELIRSDAIVHRVIEQENLLEDSEFAGGDIPDGIRRIIENRAAEPEGDSAEDLLESVTLLQVAREVRERLGVKRRGLSQGVEVSFRSRSQEKARDLANAFAESYVSDQLDNKLAASNRAIGWLRAEIEALSKETQLAEAAVEDYRARYTLVGEGEQGVGAQQLRLLTEKLSAARAEEAQADVKAGQLRSLRAAGQSLLTMPEIGDNKQIQTLRQQLSEAEQAEAEMASRYNSERRDQIPPYQEAYSHRVAVETALNREISRASAEIETRLASARAVTRSLEAERQNLRGENAEVNAATIGLNELEREAEGKRQRYETLLAEYNETNNTAAVQTPHARIVSPAELPLTPSAPRKKAAFGAAVIFSAALGMFLALLLEFSRRSIRTPDELWGALNLRPIGVLPKVGRSFAKRKRDVAVAINTLTKAPGSDYAEAVRSLRAELFLIGGRSNNGVIAVTAPDDARGKTAMAASLARSIALTGAKTLLVDADIRQANLLAKLHKKYEGPDLANVLRGQTDWRDAVIAARNSKMFILAARPGGWDEAVSHAFAGQFQKLIETWRAEYETVIINCPAVCAYPEARAIGSCVDAAILAIEWNATDRRLAVEAVGLLSEIECRPHVVMTNVAAGLYRRWLKPAAPRHSSRPQLNVVAVK